MGFYRWREGAKDTPAMSTLVIAPDAYTSTGENDKLYEASKVLQESLVAVVVSQRPQSLVSLVGVVVFKPESS